MTKYLLGICLILFSNFSFSQSISKEQALEDIDEFIALLETESSYYQLSDFDFEARYTQIRDNIQKKDSVRIDFLAYEFEKIIAETIDRHANIRFKKSKNKSSNTPDLYFPFVVSSLNGKVVVLREKKSKNEYQFVKKKYPYLKSINGILIDDFLEKYAYRRKLSPKQAQLTDALLDLKRTGKLYQKQDEEIPEKIDLVLTKGQKDFEMKLPLSREKHDWFHLGSLRYHKEMKTFFRDKNFDLSQLDQWLTDSIAYLAIPAMQSYRRNTKLEAYLKNTIEKSRNAKALIVDLRGNGGGTREILNTLSAYFVQPEQSPWVANVAHVRSDQRLNEDMSSMRGRFLFNYDSEFLSDDDREAIDAFSKNFEAKYNFDKKKFSSPFYMVLNSGEKPFKTPVYLLVNEESFSAASVFTSAFKGLPNVKVAGVTTNGSSGRSVRFYLKNSNIRVKLSTMLSFQRNGKTLDGNGTQPDVLIERREAQVLGQKDTQLEDLIEIINDN
ncbi:S41 family peptidase [Psychroflexus halocasei]|uniref:Peptidase family S41 n=1 Tax=Psychroflexus halocasei TaxID=908615 RepID=A0A1H4CL11_9FLAO|nr:S41 family peptidase [Psychroflexus halocasei]SEA60742.1 Peptidase family S41 [Psychroflexus halocasei]